MYILRLLRLHVYLPICFLITIIGLSSIGNYRLHSLITLGLASGLAFAAGFAFNDIEDATDDAKGQHPRNPVALGQVSKLTAYIVTILAAMSSLVLSFANGVRVGCMVSGILLLLFVYSWRGIRLKVRPGFDVLSHSLALCLILWVSVSVSSATFPFDTHVLALSLVLACGGATAIVIHQLYEQPDDQAANIVNSVGVLGVKRTYALLIALVGTSASLLVMEAIRGTFPLESLLAFVGVVLIIMMFSLALFHNNTKSVSKRVFPWAINIGAIIATILWYVYQ